MTAQQLTNDRPTTVHQPPPTPLQCAAVGGISTPPLLNIKLKARTTKKQQQTTPPTINDGRSPNCCCVGNHIDNNSIINHHHCLPSSAVCQPIATFNNHGH